MSIVYCFADVGIEAYKLKQRNYLNEKTNAPMTMTQLVVERSVFQALASVVIPIALIHTSVDVASSFFRRVGRFQKYGPSLVGLSVIPLLPAYIDEVCLSLLLSSIYYRCSSLLYPLPTPLLALCSAHF